MLGRQFKKQQLNCWDILQIRIVDGWAAVQTATQPSTVNISSKVKVQFGSYTDEESLEAIKSRRTVEDEEAIEEL